MKYFVFEDRECPPDWRVEGMDDEGQVFIAIFSGPDAEKRAQEYYAIKTGKLGLRPSGPAPVPSPAKTEDITLEVQGGKKVRLHLPGLVWTWDEKRKTITGRQSAIHLIQEDASATPQS